MRLVLILALALLALAPAQQPIDIASAYAAAVKTDGAIAYWKLDETSGLSFADVIGGKTATAPSATGYTLGVPGAFGAGSRGLATDGTQQPAIYAPIAVGVTSTIELWLRPVSIADGYYGIITAAINGLYFIPGPRKMNFFYGADHLNNTQLNFGVLHHVAVSNNAGNVTFYLNGVADGTVAGWPGDSFTNLFRAPANFPINASLLDDIAIYPTALTAQQIANHYAIATGTASPTRNTYARFTVSTTPVGIEPAVTQGMTACSFTVEGANVRMRIDQPPTLTIGTPIAAGKTVVLKSIADARAAQFISSTPTDAVNANCWQQGSLVTFWNFREPWTFGAAGPTAIGK